jgi:hypothetical protein
VAEGVGGIEGDLRGGGVASGLGEAKLLALFENLNGEFAGDGGEVVESVAVFEVVEEGLDGHAGAAEYGNAVHHFGVAGDGWLHATIVA